MQIECPQCSKTLSDIHIDTTANIVVCDACDAVFSPPTTQSTPAFDKKKLESEIPNRFVVQQTDDSLQISYKHNACYGIAMGVFALIWNGMLWSIFVPTFGGIALSGLFAQGGIEWENLVFGLFLLPFILAGLGVAYQALFMLLNTTTVSATSKALTIQHRPLSFPFDKVIDTVTIDQFFTKQKITRGSGGTTITYEVHVRDTNGKKRKLLGTLPEAKQALYIERELETFLGIEDRYVDGQYT